MGWSCSIYGGQDRCRHVLVGRPEGKRPLVKPMRTWKDDIKMYFQEIGCVGIARIGLAQDRAGGRCLCMR